MNIETENKKQPSGGSQRLIFSGGLGRLLLFWFLCFSLVPVIIVSYSSSKNAYNFLHSRAEDQLLAVTKNRAQDLVFYFNEASTDIFVESQNQSTRSMMREFWLTFENSRQSLKDFVKSQRWKEIFDVYGKDKSSFLESYEFEDIFLIDINGNILFTVKQGVELGTNIFSGFFSDTSNIPKGYLQIGSALGDSEPTSILVFPFLREDEVKGVIELGSLSPIRDLDIQFLNLVSENIAMAIHSAQESERIRLLLLQAKG